MNNYVLAFVLGTALVGSSAKAADIEIHYTGSTPVCWLYSETKTEGGALYWMPLGTVDPDALAGANVSDGLLKDKLPELERGKTMSILCESGLFGTKVTALKVEGETVPLAYAGSGDFRGIFSFKSAEGVGRND